jgi:hypothetical protein
MTDVQFDAPRPVTGADAETTPKDRNDKLSKLLITSHTALQDAAYEAFSGLTVFDAEKIMVLLGKELPRYGGPPYEAPFMRWATRLVTKEAQRYKTTALILFEYGRLIRTTIRAELNRPIRDYSVDVESIYWEIALLVFERAHSLAKRGRAKLSTRLVALTQKHIRFYHTSYWNRRHRLNCERVQNDEAYGVETLSPEEIAEHEREQESALNFSHS